MVHRSLLIGLAVVCAGCATARVELDEVGHTHLVARWTYEGTHGPQAWGGLEPEYAACSTGLEQSPIDIAVTAPPQSQPSASQSQLQSLSFDYHAEHAEVVNSGHTVQATFAETNKLRIGDVDYKLLQFHYHHPSEHTVDGRPAPLEIHFVHHNAAGQLAVVGVMFDEGPTANAALAAFLHSVGGAGTIDAAGLLPDNHAYFTYAGSLTTPPCSEGVTWLVLTNRMSATHDQLEALRHLVHANARPLQPKGNRAVQLIRD